MLIVKISTAPAAAVPGGPAAATFTLPGGSGQAAAARVEIPAGDGEVAEIVLILLSGAAELRHDGQTRTLAAGMTARIGPGEGVSLANDGPQPASFMVVATPADLAGQLASWPAA